MPETQTDTLHDRIRARVAEERAEYDAAAQPTQRSVRLLLHCDHADRILDRHARSCGYFSCVEVPCLEVRDLAEAWGVTDA